MDFRRQTSGNSRAIASDPGAAERHRSYPVRLSLVSREMLVVSVLVAVAGYLVNLAQDGTTIGQPARQVLHGHDTMVERLVYVEGGRTLVSCGWDRQVKFWDLMDEQPGRVREMDILHHNWPVYALAISADGRNLAAGGAGGFTIWTRERNGGTWEPIAEHRGGIVRCLAASPDNRTLALGDCDGVLRLYDIQTGKEMFILDRFGDQLRTVSFSPSGSFIAASAIGGEFRVWDLQSSGRPHVLAGGPQSVQSFAFAPDDRTLAVAQSGPRATALGLWDVQTGTPLLPLSSNPTGSNSLAFSADGRVMASADRDQAIRVWDTSTGELEETVHDGVGWVKTLAFSPDGRQIAFGGNNGNIQLHDLPLKSGQQMQTHSS